MQMELSKYKRHQHFRFLHIIPVGGAKFLQIVSFFGAGGKINRRRGQYQYQRIDRRNLFEKNAQSQEQQRTVHRVADITVYSLHNQGGGVLKIIIF